LANAESGLGMTHHLVASYTTLLDLWPENNEAFNQTKVIY